MPKAVKFDYFRLIMIKCGVPPPQVSLRLFGNDILGPLNLTAQIKLFYKGILLRFGLKMCSVLAILCPSIKGLSQDVSKNRHLLKAWLMSALGDSGRGLNCKWYDKKLFIINALTRFLKTVSAMAYVMPIWTCRDDPVWNCAF